MSSSRSPICAASPSTRGSSDSRWIPRGGRRAGTRTRPAPRDHRRDRHGAAAQQQDAQQRTAVAGRPRGVVARARILGHRARDAQVRELLGDPDRPGHRDPAGGPRAGCRRPPGRRRSAGPTRSAGCSATAPGCRPGRRGCVAASSRTPGRRPASPAARRTSPGCHAGPARPPTPRAERAERRTGPRPAPPPRPTTRRRRGRPGRGPSPRPTRVAAAVRTRTASARSLFMPANLPGRHDRHNRTATPPGARSRFPSPPRPVTVAPGTHTCDQGEWRVLLQSPEGDLSGEGKQGSRCGREPERDARPLVREADRAADQGAPRRRRRRHQQEAPRAPGRQAPGERRQPRASGRGRAPGRPRGPGPHGARAQGRRPGPAREHRWRRRTSCRSSRTSWSPPSRS